MIRHRATTLCLLATLTCASPALAADVEIGVYTTADSRVRYRGPTVAQERKLRRIEPAVLSRLHGDAQIRQVRFDYEHRSSQSLFVVRGVLYGWRNMRVVSYRMADLEQAVKFADHDRAELGARRLIEVRGERVLVFSGSSMNDPSLVAAIRAWAWPKSAGRRVDVLGLQDSIDDLKFVFSQEALGSSQFLRSWHSQQQGTMGAMASMDPNAVLTSAGGIDRLETDGSIFTIGAQGMALYSSLATERAYADFFHRLGPPTPIVGPSAPTSVAASAPPGAGGLTATLGAVTGGGAAPKLVLLGDHHQGQRVRVRAGDTIRLERPGNTSLGYEWSLAAPLSLLKEVGSGYRISGPQAGTGGVFWFTWRAEQPGTENLRLQEIQPWSGNTMGAFQVTIEVQ